MRLNLKALSAIVPVFLLAGCIFAPPKFGPRGIVLPGDQQYEQYLEHCRTSMPAVESRCSEWGKPEAIKIGHSGGIFVWKSPQMIMSIGSFGSTKLSARIPRDLRQFAGILPPARAVAPAAVRTPEKASYVIDRFERIPGDEYAYAFRLTAKDSLGMRATQMLKDEVRRVVSDEYLATYGRTAGASVQIDFPEFSVERQTVSGKAVVMQLDIVSLNYDSRTQKGVIRIKIGAYKYEDVRQVVRRNIETIARDKNIALVTGEVPPQAHFFLGDERVLDGGILEVEFETE